MLIGFIETLHDYGLPMSMRYVLDFYEGLRRGLVNNLDELFLYARLCFVKRVEHMDTFERAFAFYFTGVVLPAVGKGDPELLNTPEFREWLRRAIQRGEIQPITYNMSAEELMRRFWDTLERQMEEHHGGDRWVGTGGTSPFGHTGFSRGGVRVYGDSRHQSARRVFGDRRYVDYSELQNLKDNNVRRALETLKFLKKSGGPTELDVPETVYRSSRNGGEIELIFKPELRDRIQLVLFIDNGGSSMLPYVDLTLNLFRRLKERIRSMDTYYFHNTIYDSVYSDAARTRAVDLRKILNKNADTRIVILGDASMAPDELVDRYGGIFYEPEHAGRGASIGWLRMLR
ncbi:MAG: hypothetical protein KDK34_19125, partial [Leptospiraceae bacterium]|nr:hypothetical protein [Leptospiraceae bacterium]